MVRHILPKSTTSALTIVAAVGLAVAGLFTTGGSARARGVAQTATEDKYVTQPDHWVPFTVGYTMILGQTQMTVIDFHASDGSRKSVREGGPRGEEIRIDNLPAKRHYDFVDGKWTEHPLRLQQGNGSPLSKLLRSKVRVVPSNDARVKAVADVVPQTSFYELPGRSGNSAAIFCPELNLLEVWSSFGAAMEHRTDYVILGEPNVDFAPPAGAEVAQSVEPAGRGLATAADLNKIQQQLKRRRR